MPTRASKHKQGMAKEHEPKPAAAIATGIEGPRTDNEHEVHNADLGNAMKTTPHPLSIGHQRGRKMWTPPKNTRRTRSRQHRGTEHEWYEGIPNGKKRWYEGRPPPAKPRDGSHTPPERTPPPPNTQTTSPRAQKEQGAIKAGGSITQQAGLPALRGCFVKTLGLSPSCLRGVGRLLHSPCTAKNKVARYAQRMVLVVRT